MDPASWMEYSSVAQNAYGHLRVPGSSQVNSACATHQYTHNRGLHQLNHMASFSNATTACHKGTNQTANARCQTNHMPDHASGQALMNRHYNSAPLHGNSSKSSSWFFNTDQQQPQQQQQQHSNHDAATLQQVRSTNPDQTNSSFNAASFGFHNGMYDTSFMHSSFQQQSGKSTNYMPSMTTGSGYMKKHESNVNYRNSNYCPSTGVSAQCASSLHESNLPSGSFFPSHSLPTASGTWSHQNYIPPNRPNGGMLPHDPVNVMSNSTAAAAPSHQQVSYPRSYNRNSCSVQAANSVNALNNEMSSKMVKPSQNGNLDASQYKGPTSTGPFTGMSLASNNPYLMQNFSSTRSGQNSFVDPSFGAKFAAAAAHHHVASDHYASLAFAAAMNSEYAFQQQAQKHQQYMSSMNNFAPNLAGHSSDYSAMGFDSTNHFNSNRHASNLMNYCSAAPLLTMAHSEKPTSSSLKSNHNAMLGQLEFAHTFNQQQQPTSKSSRKTLSSTQKRATQDKADTDMNATLCKYVQSSSNNVCNSAMSTKAVNGLLNGSGNNVNVNITSSNVSRCSSVASNHQMQQNNDPYSYNYSPATTSLSAHSPYQQRSSTSNSSHSSATSCALTNGDFLNYGTPNSAPPTVFPTLGTSQTPTPTPGYPTPPSSVGHSSSRCNSNEELSPYSNNSMSSSISQPYYKSPNSQISPKQLDNGGISESVQFNSCMIASQKGASMSSDTRGQPKQLLNSTAMFTDSQQSYSYSNQLSTSTGSSCSSDLYLDYSEESSSMQMNHPSSMSVMTVNNNSDSNCNNQANSISDSAYEFRYEQSASDEFEQSFSNKTELPSCAHQGSKSTNQVTSDHLIDNIESKSSQFQNGRDMSSHESFNLNFDSVIPPLEMNLSEQHVEEHTLPVPSEDSSMRLEDIRLGDSKSFHSIDELSFMDNSHPEPVTLDSLGSKHSSYSVDHAEQTNSQQMEQCERLDYQSSHSVEAHSVLDSASLECSHIQSIIDSLPKSACLHADKSDDTNELLDHADNFPSDLAPLMNDNSKIALMESTFKSNDISAIDHDKDLDLSSTSSFDKINKDLFDVNTNLKINSCFTYQQKQTEEDNRLKDVDEFLEKNLREVHSLSDNVSMQDCQAVQVSIAECSQIQTEHLLEQPAHQSITVPKPIESSLVSTVNEPLSIVAESNAPTVDNIISNSCDRDSSKNEKSKSSKRKVSEVLGAINESTVNKKRKVAVVMPKSKECKKTSEFNEFNDSFEKVNNKPSKKPISESKTSKSKNVFKTKEKQESTPKLNKKVNTQDNVVSKKSSAKTARVIGNVQSKSKTKSTKSASNEVKKNVNDQQSTGKSSNKQTSKSVAGKACSLSEAKENVASISTSTSSKSKISGKSGNNKKLSSLEQVAEKVVTNKDKDAPSGKSDKTKQVNGKTSKPKSTTLCTTVSKLTKSGSGLTAKPLLANLTSNNSGTLLPQASPLLKSVSSSRFNLAPPANVAPALIVNQNASVSSYQVSPMTNAVLISINPTPIPSLTAPSTFITLNTPSATAPTSTTTTTASGATQNAASRRRSQDKKVLTVREGLMRTGDFVVAEEEAHLELPVIWRIEGKSLLQRFEPSSQNGVTVYINTSSYSAWNPTVRQKYLGLDVRIMGCNRTRIVVEKLGLTRTKSKDSASISLEEKTPDSPNAEPPLSPVDFSQYLETFEILIQTLISQALDPSFIAEMIKENDEYFIASLRTIDTLCKKRRHRFAIATQWEANIMKCIETYVNIEIHKQHDIGDLRCRLCLDNWSTKILQFEGDIYNFDTLEPVDQVEAKQTKLASCDSCTEKTFMYSRLCHLKYIIYQCCKSKVYKIKSQDEDRESSLILEECIQDTDWVKKMFAKIESILISCDNVR